MFGINHTQRLQRNEIKRYSINFFTITNMINKETAEAYRFKNICSAQHDMAAGKQITPSFLKEEVLLSSEKVAAEEEKDWRSDNLGTESGARASADRIML